MDNVVLKGKNKQYYLEINSDSDLKQSFKDIQKLLADLQKSTKETAPTDELPVIIDTQNRLLTKKQMLDLTNLVAKFHLFSNIKVINKVLDRAAAEKYVQENQLNIETKIVRSGQIVTYQGNLLLMGGVHRSGEVRASGDIYIMSPVDGIVHAGYPNNNQAIIIGDLSHASQLRISDLIAIVADLEVDKLTEQTLFYVNDLHNLAQDQVQNLNDIKPQMGIVLD